MFTDHSQWLRRLTNPKIVLCIFISVVAFYIRIDFVKSVTHHMPHDSVNYDIMVRQLLEKGVYAYKSEEPNAQVTPGYPLLMAGVYILADYKNHDPFPSLDTFKCCSAWLPYGWFT